jgi:hypothetical protein
MVMYSSPARALTSHIWHRIGGYPRPVPLKSSPRVHAQNICLQQQRIYYYLPVVLFKILDDLVDIFHAVGTMLSVIADSTSHLAQLD